MPGNDVGDRVHNFFEQGSLSQDQRHTQLVEGSWPVFNNNSRGGSERQIGGHLASSHKNYSAQHSESIERANQFSLGPYGLNPTQSSLRPELLKNTSHPPQLNLNGFMHTSQVAHSRQNETNFLGVDAGGSDRHSLTSRGLSILESQQRSGSPQTHPVSFGSSESPMNFNFFAGQQQMSGQQPGMMQFNDAQLLSQQLMMKQMQDFQRPLATNDPHLTPQQLMLKQMQDIQRQRQIHQFDAMQRNVANQIPTTFPNQMAGQHSLAINGNPMYDGSNYPWSSQGNVNWVQQGISSPMQGYSNGFMVTPEQQGQALRFMGLTQQAPHSLYGVPVSNSRNDNTFGLNQFDNRGVVPQVSAPSNSFPGNNQYAPLPEQASVQGGAVSRPGSEGRNSLDHGSSQGLGNMVSFGGFNQMEQKNAPVSESGRQNSGDGFQLLPEKSEALAASKQADVGLDPTEEKILFGNDESIWEAFGSSVMNTGGANRPDSSDLCDGPPLLSGTWSALMQSAVAETSSTEAGMQEEWSGLDDQNNKSQSSGNKQSSVFPDNVQQQSAWAQNASNNVNSSYVNSSGFQKPFLNQPSQSLPTESQKHWAFENANPSRDFSKNDVGFLSNQQSKFLHENNEQSSARPNALNFMESVPANGNMASGNQVDVHLREHNRHMSMDTVGSTTQRHESISNYNVNMGNPRDGGPNTRNLVNNESKQNFNDNRHLDFWRSVNSSAQFGIQGAGKDQHTLSEGRMGPDGGASEIHEAENGDVGENSNDSHQSSIQNQGLGGGLRENTAWPGAGNRRSLHGGIEKPPEQVHKPMPVTRKFQYHPMGDLDVDEDSFPSKQTHRPSQPMMPQDFSSGFRGHETQGRAFFHGRSNTADGVSPGGIPPGQFSSTSTPFGKSGQLSSQHQNLPPSQNMLELLHKVDQPEEQTSVSHLSSTGGNGLSEMAPAVNLNQQNQSSTSHGFNLQLAPPSQGIAPSNVSVTSQGSGTVDSQNSGFAAFERGDKGHVWLGSAQFSPSSRSLPQMTSENLKESQSGPLASGSSYLRNPLQHHRTAGTGGKMIPDHSSLPFDKHSYLDRPQDQATGRQSVSNSLNNLASGRGMNRFGLRPSMPQMPMSSPAMWSQNHLSGAHAQVQPNDAPGTSFVSEQQDHMKRAGSEAQPTGKTLGGSEEEPAPKHMSEASPSNSAASQKDFENQAIKPNKAAEQSYSLPDQTQAMKSTVADPSHHESKRLKGTGETYASDSQEIMGQREPNSSGGQSRIPPFQLAHGTLASRETIPFGPTDPQKLVTSGAEHSGIIPEIVPSWFQQYRTFKNGQSLPIHNIPRVQIARNVDPQSISGTPMNNSDGCDSMQLANNASTDPSSVADACQTANVNVPSEGVSSLDPLVPHVADPVVAPVRPKKRKTATSDLLSFSKEVGQSFPKLQNMSSAEVDWAKSSNRLVEKVEDGTDAQSDDMARLNRPKRRLMLTTQLMQNVFPSPSPAVLSLDASVNHETIVYSLARSALGDACASVGCSGSDSSVPPNSENPVGGTRKTSERDQHFSKVAEHFMSRAKELENELLRLDKRASILDFRLDLQDLDRFAVINRFARFHGRSQADGPDSSSTSTSSDPTVTQQRPLLQCPQRYVSAHTMPRNIPDRVQCLSL